MGLRTDRPERWARRLVAAAALGVVAYLAWPFPDETFLYRTLPDLRGRIVHLKGASVVAFIDPSFFYRGEMQAADVDRLIDRLALEPRSSASFDAKAFTRSGPLFWHAWWWAPQRVAEPRYFVGDHDGNSVYLLRDADGPTVYFYIQNN